MKETDLVSWHAQEYLKRRPGAFYHKLPDTLGVGGKRPFDAFIIDGGVTYAIEFKLHKKHTAFSLAKIEPHQIENLQLAQANGAVSTIYIGIRFLLDIDDQERLGFRVRRISADLEYPVDYIAQLIASGQKSLKVLPLLRKATRSE